MKHSRLFELSIALTAHVPKFLLRHIILKVPVALFLFGHSHVRDWKTPVMRGIVMSRPDLVVIRKAQELASGAVQCLGAASRKITACGAHIGVEDGIAAENVVCETGVSANLQVCILPC